MTNLEFRQSAARVTGNRSDTVTDQPNTAYPVFIRAFNFAQEQLASVLTIPDRFGRPKPMLLDIPELETQMTATITTGTVTNLGTVTVTNGSAVVTGVGTTWSYLVRLGDTFAITGGNNYSVNSVQSDTQLTLSALFAETGGSGLTYTITGFQDLLTLDPSIMFVRQVYLVNINQPLDPTNNWYINRQGFAARGAPVKYTRLGAALRLFPPPDKAYLMRINGRRRPTTFSVSTTDSATPDYTLHWHEALDVLTKGKILRDLNELDLMQYYLDQFVKIIQDLIVLPEAENANQDDAQIVLDPRWIARI